MTFPAILILAFGLSVDAFVAALGRSLGHGRPRLMSAVGTGATFGVMEAAITLIGWLAGDLAADTVREIDHWIAFALLAIVGGCMIHQALRNGTHGRHSRRAGPMPCAAASDLP